MKLSQQDIFGTTDSATPPGIGKPFFSVTIPGRLPSWNAILGMEQWQRYQFKQDLADVFLSELKRSESGSSTKIICAANTTLTCSATLESYLRTRQELRKLKSAKKRSARRNPSASRSKSTSSKVPF